MRMPPAAALPCACLMLACDHEPERGETPAAQVHQGKLDIEKPNPVKESSAGDPRSRITIDQMLRMVDGLRFRSPRRHTPRPDKPLIYMEKAN